jgi:hypothetical protein
MIPDSPDALLTRAKAADALTALGYPVAASTLSTKATRGEGPRYQRFGRKPLYRWSDCVRWAEGKMTPPRKSVQQDEALAGAVA